MGKFIVWIVFCCSLFAQNFPFLSSRVIDETKILDPSIKAQIEKKLEIYENNSSNQIAVVSIKSLNGAEISSYGIDMARHYKLGDKDKNNGVLLLIAPFEREITIQVGYGLEGVLTDKIAHEIIEYEILPYFRKGDINSGILRGVDAIISATNGEFKADKNQNDEFVSPLFFVLFFVSVFLNILTSKTNINIFRRIGSSSLGGSVVSIFASSITQNLYIISIVFAFSFILFFFMAKFKTGRNFDDFNGFSSSFGGSSRGFGGFSRGGFKGGGGSFGGGGAKGKW